MLVLSNHRVKETFCGLPVGRRMEREPDIRSQRRSPSRFRTVDAVRHPSQEQMVLTVGTLSVPKDTQGPAGFPPASSLPRQCTCAWASGATSVCQEQIMFAKGDMRKPQHNAQRLLKTYDINKCDLSIQKILDAILGAGDTVEIKPGTSSTLLKLTV